MLPILLNFFLKIETEIPLTNAFCVVNITLIPKLYKDIPREANYRQTSLMNIKAINLKKY